MKSKHQVFILLSTTLTTLAPLSHPSVYGSHHLSFTDYAHSRHYFDQNSKTTYSSAAELQVLEQPWRSSHMMWETCFSSPCLIPTHPSPGESQAGSGASS